MSFPVEADAAQILIGNGGTPTELFTVFCGIEQVGLNNGVQGNDKYRRDCAKPGQVPTRSTQVTGKNWAVSGSGVLDVGQMPTYLSSLGVRKNYRIILIQYDGTDAGKTLGTVAGSAVLMGANMNVGESGGVEINLNGENLPTWTPAP